MWYEDKEEFGRVVSRKLKACRRYDVWLKGGTSRAPVRKAISFDDFVAYAGGGANLMAYTLVPVEV